MKKIGVYHNADLDGKCSAAIMRHKYGAEIELIGMNYGDPIPSLDADLIIISDFSFDEATMQSINESVEIELLWFDHHECLWDDGSIKGCRDKNKAGCELTWQGLFPDEAIPLVVEDLGAYDTWRWVKCPKDVQEQILDLQWAMRLDAWEPTDPKWSDLLEHDVILADSIRSTGGAIRKYQRQMMRRICLTGSLTDWNESVFFVVNCQQSSSLDYEEKIQEFRDAGVPIDAIMVYWKIKEHWKYSLRSCGDLDVSAIARQYGGGGHKGAAGFMCDYLLDCIL